MRFIWEEKDITAGRHVALGNGAAERWMIGYFADAIDNKKWTLVSLSDGMILGKPYTKAELAANLNDNNNVPVSI
jgi:hypothetical protein